MAQIRKTRAEIIILDNTVITLWNLRNKDYYQSLGYRFSRYGGEVSVCLAHLRVPGKTMVSVVCPLCGEERATYYYDILNVGHTFCKGCAKIEDLRGEKFGKLTVVDIDKKSIKGPIRWFCSCECGGSTNHLSGNLRSGKSISCGCHIAQDRRDRQRKRKQKKEKRNSIPGYRSWKKLIKKRAGWRCECCGTFLEGKKLVAHHLDSYDKFPGRALDLDNGAALCRACHYDFHCNYMGGWKITCTADDYHAWLAIK